MGKTGKSAVRRSVEILGKLSLLGKNWNPGYMLIRERNVLSDSNIKSQKGGKFDLKMCYFLLYQPKVK